MIKQKTNNTTTINTEKQIKNIGDYQFKHIIDFNNRTGDYISLSLYYSEELRKLIRKAVIEETLTENLYSCDTTERYKVKSIIYNGINSRYKGFLFIKELIDTGKTTIKILNIRDTEYILNCLQSDIKELIRYILKFDNYETTITINIKEKSKNE